MAGSRIGCHTLTWGNHFGDYTLKDALCEIKEAGYDGAEIYDALAKLGPPGRLRTQLDEAGLELASLSANINVGTDERRDIAEAKEKAYYAAQFGVKALMVTGGWRGDGLSKDAKSYKALGRRVDSLAKYASGLGISVAFHNHLDTIVEDERDLADLLEFSESAKLCIDTGHLAAAGSDAVSVIEKFRASVALVHLKDWDPKIRDFTELGRGILCHNMKNILASLDRINYTGWVVVELDRTSSTPFGSARFSRDFLRGIGY